MRPQGEYEEQNDGEISTISSNNDLLEQPLRNETSEDKIAHNLVGQNEFKTRKKIKWCNKTSLITAYCGTDLDLREKEIREKDNDRRKA